MLATKTSLPQYFCRNSRCCSSPIRPHTWLSHTVTLPSIKLVNFADEGYPVNYVQWHYDSFKDTAHTFNLDSQAPFLEKM